jgi:hypothetical protein
MKKELKIFDNPKNVKRLLLGFYLSLVLLIGIDILVELLVHKHVDFPWEKAPAFYAVYGFVSCVSLIFIAKFLRLIVKRGEDYYE